MANVRYDCPVEGCGTRAFDEPGSTLMGNPRCTQHNVDMVQSEEFPGAQFDPGKYTGPKVLDEAPTSPDAVTADGRIVGVEEGLGSKGHGIPAGAKGAEKESVSHRQATSAKSGSKSS